MADSVIDSLVSKIQKFLTMREYVLIGTPAKDELYPAHQDMYLVVPPPSGSKNDPYGFTDSRRHELCYLASNNQVYRTEHGFLRVSINLLTLNLLYDMPMPKIIDKPKYPVGRIYSHEIYLALVGYHPGTYIEMQGVDGTQKLEVV
jgi:hypothetical protein